MRRELSNQLQTAFENGRFQDVLQLAGRQLHEGESALPAVEIATIHRWRGLSAHELGDHEVATRSLTFAFRWDTTDRRVGIALGRLLLERGDDSAAWDVLENVLAHHAESLTPRACAGLAFLLARSYARSGNPLAARRHLEAISGELHRVPHAESLLADVWSTTGDRARAIALRRRLIESATDPSTRAQLVLRLAEDLKHAGEDLDAADLLESTAAALNPLLDDDPSAVDRFEDQVRLLTEAESWTALHEAYERMTGRIGDSVDDNTHAKLALLWRKMGDVSDARLGLSERAQEEYATAERHRIHAENPVYRPTGTHDVVVPIDELWQNVLADPQNLDHARTYGNALLNRGDRHYGNTVLSVVAALDDTAESWDRDEVTAVAWGAERFREQLTDELRTLYMRPPERRAALDAVFHVGCRVAGHLFVGSDGATRDARNRIHSNEPRPVVRLFEEISADLGYTAPPTLYASREPTGLRSGGTLAPSFLIGEDVMQAAGEPSLRFRIGQLLTMGLPRFFLAASMTPAQLADIAFALTGIHLDGHQITDPQRVSRVQAIVKEGMSDRWQSALDEATDRLSTGPAPSIHEWLRWVSVEAARTGLLCAGRAPAALEAATRYPALAEAQDPQQRRWELGIYAMSPEFERLKRELGLSR